MIHETLGTLAWLAPSFGVAFALLHGFLPAERNQIRTSGILFALSVLGMLGAGWMLESAGGKTGMMYDCVNGVSLLLGGIAIVNLAGVAIFVVILRPARLEPPQIAQDLLLALAYIVMAILILSHTGVDVRGLVATSAVITAIIGFSLQDSLGNIMGGLALQMERTIRTGDWIKLDDIEGKVKTIRWRQTSIETRNWDTVVIPNTVLMKTRVTLLGRRGGAPQQRRQWVYFRVGLEHSPARVIQTVETALHDMGHVTIATDPKPHCLVTDFKEGEAIYAYRYWLNDLSKGDPTDSVVRTRIHAALRRAGIPLSVPTRTVTVNEESESIAQRQQSAEMDRRVGALGRQEFFHALTEEERRELAPRLVTTHFVHGEAMTRQGAKANWLYLIAEGDAEVVVGVDGKSQRVATLHGGDLFGEMGLMTGEPRSATVYATTEVTCYRLGKEAFEEVLRSRPEIAEQIAGILARRKVELEAVREQMGQETRGERIRTLQGALLRGIRDFFALH
jgi:small-conductance mechanosensitive channel/CRP-like cAMP-binding protein